MGYHARTVIPVLAIAGWLLAQVGVGFLLARRIRTEDDYLVAGRRLGYPLLVFSTFATWFGAETCIGAAGRAAREGVHPGSAEPFGYALCLLLMALVFAVPLWRRRLTTFADLFRDRFSPAVERSAALVLIPSSVLWAAAQMRGFAHVLAVVTDLPVPPALTVAAGLCVLYTAVGGLLADAVNDLLQSAVLVTGLSLLLWAVVERAGGPAAAAQAFAASERVRLSAEGSLLDSLEAWAVPVLGSVLATELVSRVIAARSPEVARRGTLLAGGAYLAAGAVPVFVGVVAGGWVPGLADPEQLLPALARQLLGPLAFGLFAAALVAAILSTVDSTLLVASGLLSHNLLAPLLGVRGERGRVWLARAGVAGFGLLAWGLALRAEGVFALVEQASAFGGAGILVVSAFGLFGRWGGPRAALLSLLGSTAAFLGFVAAGLRHPFLLSLGAALGLYAAGAAWERGARPATPAPGP